MSTNSEQHDVAKLWERYEPSGEQPWNRARVAHLHRRAGFAVPWEMLERDLREGPSAAIDRLVTGQAPVLPSQSDFEAIANTIGEAATASGNALRVKAWWLYRMLRSPDPLGERLTLMWHNHFATSERKVKNLAQMRRQNELLRKHARGPYVELLSSVVHDPALLIWLDADRNRAGHPNENLARELLELFTLGIGNYTERDVQETARALTGWRVVNDEFRIEGRLHDESEKTVLGETSVFAGDELLRRLATQPATARRIAWRLCDTFFGEAPVEPAAVEALAQGLQEHNFETGWGVETIVRSRRFFAADNIAARVMGPPEYIVGVMRALECSDPPPSTLLLAEWTDRAGQELLYPPNVGGWDQGRAWLGTGGVIARANFATALANGRMATTGGGSNWQATVDRHAGGADLAGRVAWLGELFCGGLPSEVTGAVAEQAQSASAEAGDPLVLALPLLLMRPELQLG